jgi:hypothetical protein
MQGGGHGPHHSKLYSRSGKQLVDVISSALTVSQYLVPYFTPNNGIYQTIFGSVNN